LIGLSLPFALQERALARGAFSKTSRARVAMLLPTAGLPDDVTLPPLSTEAELRAGRDVLVGKCVACHDLKTILAKPRSPSDWWTTVARMADKPALVSELTPEDQYRVTAYLIAITPDLKRATKRKRTAAVADVATPRSTPLDLAKAKVTFTEACSGCHEITDVDANPPKTTAECSALVQRMIDDNDAKLTTDQVALITAYLVAHYVEKTAP
jgi:mono/diheme cytochrome c family protein